MERSQTRVQKRRGILKRWLELSSSEVIHHYDGLDLFLLITAAQ